MGALAWIVAIIGLLVFMTGISMSHEALLETLISLLALAFVAAGYYLFRRKKVLPVATVASAEIALAAAEESDGEV